MRTLVWFRGKDLRVADHAPLVSAVERGEVVCAFVVDPYFFAKERARALPHRMQVILESLAELSATLERLGARLAIVEGKSIDVIPRIVRAWRIDRVVAHRWSEPFGRERDARIAKALDVPFELFEGETLAAPGAVLGATGHPFSLFTPFAKVFRNVVHVPSPLTSPRKLPPLPSDLRIARTRVPTLADIGVSHNAKLLPGGERAARARLTRFLEHGAKDYATQRDRLDVDGTSRLSVDLKLGTLSVRTVWTAARRALEKSHPAAWKSFSNELLWRELAYDLVRHRPSVLERPAHAEWERFPWTKSEARWRAWTRGETGFPIVDASARQLLAEGFVPNRARMISASFLVKDLLVDYRRGEAHYLAYLADGDWANNNLGWQWSVGCGADAQPYFRVFNPVEQSRRFDAQGTYIRRWLPELAALDDANVHAPFDAPKSVLAKAGIVLGQTYPKPIVDHAAARTRFLELSRAMKRQA